MPSICLLLLAMIALQLLRNTPPLDTVANSMRSWLAVVCQEGLKPVSCPWCHCALIKHGRCSSREVGAFETEASRVLILKIARTVISVFQRPQSSVFRVKSETDLTFRGRYQDAGVVLLI